ncbi:MAG: hypothetical protein IJU31_00995 [Synergistaceae bacterium]|nr:hypothetical protein [Synergistaceae bacterium]
MFTRELTVQPSDVSCQGTIKLKSLLDYFQNTAGLAVEDIEGTTTELIARGYAWVLTRYEIEITGKLPSLDEKFFINTFHDPSHGYNTLRVFDVRADSGLPIVFAKSSWLLLDLANGRPVKAGAHLPEILKRDTQEINPDFQDISDEAGEVLRSVEFPVRFHDLDYNAHVNNAAYFAWVFDECPIDFMTHSLKAIRASFRSGAKFGEKVTLNYSELGKNIFSCRIIRENVAKPSANFILEWQEI